MFPSVRFLGPALTVFLVLAASCSPAPDISAGLAGIDRLPIPEITDPERNLAEPVVAELPASATYEYLVEIGANAEAEQVREAVLASGTDLITANLVTRGGPEPWQYGGHVFGYIAPRTGSQAHSPVIDATAVQPDLSLRNATLRITLDRLVVEDYPGNGTHNILFDFSAKHQLSGQSENPHFSQTYRVQEGDQAGITGYPIFVGLRTGTDGIDFKASTVNVKNDDDERFLGFMQGSLFEGGLQLLNSVNPVIPVVSGFVTGIAEGIAKRNRNKPVQDVYVGLDFSTVPARAKLREGNYVVIQAPDPASWDWTKWQFSYLSGQLVATSGGRVPYNYFVIGVSKR